LKLQISEHSLNIRDTLDIAIFRESKYRKLLAKIGQESTHV